MAARVSGIHQLFVALWIPPTTPPCAIEPDYWADPKIYSKNPWILYETVSTCLNLCSYKDECLSSAMAEEGSKETVGRYGIRGGTLPKERYRMYKNRLKELKKR